MKLTQSSDIAEAKSIAIEQVRLAKGRHPLRLVTLLSEDMMQWVGLKH